MAIVAALSTRNIASVSEKVNALSEFYLPLQRAVEEARLSGAQQVINLERMLHTQSVARDEKKLLAEQQSLFEQRGREADGHVFQAIAMADRAVKEGKLPADERKLLERLRDRELPDIVEARQHLHLTTLKYLQQLDTGDRKATQLFREVV